MLGYKSSSSYLNKGTKRQEKQTAAQTASEGAGRLYRFGSAMKDKSKGDDVVTRLQKSAAAENERQRKKKEEAESAKKSTATKSTAPQKGFIGRMIDKYYYGKKE